MPNMTLVMLPVPVALAAVILVSAAAALAVTFGLGTILRPRLTDELKNLSSSSATRHGAVLALILALAFNSVMREHNELSESIDEEAVRIAQVLEDIVEEIGAPDGVPAIRELGSYVQAVLHEDWQAQEPFAESLTAGENLYRLRTHLDSIQPDYKETVTEMDKLLDEIEQRRLQRLFDHSEQLPGLFWVLAILLFVFALLPFSHYAPTRESAIYIGGYGAAIGIVMYGILMFSTPFNSSTPIDHTPLRLSLVGIERACKNMSGCRLPSDPVAPPATGP